MGDSDDDDSVFEGFSVEDLVKIDPTNYESDLDIDFEALLSDGDSESDSSDEEGDSLPTPSTGSWSSRLQDVKDAKFTEDFGPVHKLPVDAEPAHYFGLFFGDEIFKVMAEETNRYASQLQAEKGADTKWRPTTDK